MARTVADSADPPPPIASGVSTEGKGTTEGALTHLSAEDFVALHTLIHLYPHFIDKSMYREVQRLQNAPSMGIGHGQIVYPDGTPRTRHTGSNIRIVSDRPGRAFAYINYTLLHQPFGHPLHIGITGTWGYRFEQVDGIWYVAERRDGGARLWGDLTLHLNPVPPEAVPKKPAVQP
jgi:hypothetical protein